MSELKFTAPVWTFPDNINTDLIMPSACFALGAREQVRFVFQANRPGWVDTVSAGDILVGGRNFGMGSSRPAARSLKNLGLGCLVAHSINGLFFRNCVNFAFPAMECPGVHEAFSEGQRAEVDFERAVVRNLDTGVELAGRPMPAKLMELVRAGGIYPMLEQRGLIGPAPAG
jgi:3-isopropylmalate/(R)-2-methylmalate dehydratase small subunit